MTDEILYPDEVGESRDEECLRPLMRRYWNDLGNWVFQYSFENPSFSQTFRKCDPAAAFTCFFRGGSIRLVRIPRTDNQEEAMTDFKPPFEVSEGPCHWHVRDANRELFSGGHETRFEARRAAENANRLAGYEPPRTIKVEIPKPWGAQYVPQNIVQARFDTREQAQQFLDAIKGTDNGKE